MKTTSTMRQAAQQQRQQHFTASISHTLAEIPSSPFVTRTELAIALGEQTKMIENIINDPDSLKGQEWLTPSDIGKLFGVSRERAADWLRKPAAEGRIRMMRPNGDGVKGTYYNISDVYAVFAVKNNK